MRTRAMILLVALFASNVFAEFPCSDKKERQKHLMYHPADSGSSFEMFSSDEFKPFAEKDFEKDLIFESLGRDNDYQSLTGLDGIIEVSSDITSNTIWTADNMYHVLCPIDVNGAMLVIEPGTIIYFAAGTDAGIRVVNGGTLISRGTPDNPIVFTSDASSPWINDYYYAVYIEETASTASQITYNVIEWAYAGIALFNIDLDTNIENNYLMACVWGIVEYGPKHTDIINNLCFGSEYCGIYLSMASLYGVANADSHILIQNNTCEYYQERGITIYGADNPDDAGECVLENNIVSGSCEYGLSFAPDDYVYATVTNTGYYNNYMNKNWDFPESYPVEVVSNPYIEGPGGLDYCYLEQSCPFIDAGLQYVKETPLIGKTTDLDDVPDSNKIDIGFHYPNWDYSNAGTTTLQADFDNNLRVDYNDLAFFMNFWLYDYNEAYEVLYWDYVGDGRIDFMDLAYLLDFWPDYFNFVDFADFANQWQREVDERYFDKRPNLVPDDIINFRDFAVLANEWGKMAEGNPAISVSVIGDTNNLKGEVGVSVAGCSYSTSEIFIFMDGQFIGKTIYEPDDILGITINTPSYINGSHFLKAVVSDFNRPFTVSENLAVDFNNPVYCLNIEDTYEPNQPLRLLGLNSSGNNLMVKLSKWWNGEIIWSQQISGDLNLNIPGSVLAGQIYDVSVEQEIITGLGELDSQQLASKSSSSPEIDWECIWERAIAAKYDPDKLYQFAIFLPSTHWWQANSSDTRKNAVAGIVNSCEAMGLEYIILYEAQCTWANFAKVLSKPSVFYAYVVSRGASALRGIYVDQRTYFQLSDGYVVSYLSHSELLGGGWDNRQDVHSMVSLGLGDTDQFKLVWIDVCLNGLYNDMAQAWMDLSDIPVLDKIYVSWNGTIITSNEECFAEWSAFFWCDPKGFGTQGSRRYLDAYTQAQIWVDKGAWVSSKCGNHGDPQTKFTSSRY